MNSGVSEFAPRIVRRRFLSRPSESEGIFEEAGGGDEDGSLIDREWKRGGWGAGGGIGEDE